MQKVIYSGMESGLFILDALYNYLKELKGFSQAHDSRDKTFRYLGWENKEKNVGFEYSHRNLCGREEVTFTIFADKNNGSIGEFEKLLLEEHQRRIKPQ